MIPINDIWCELLTQLAAITETQSWISFDGFLKLFTAIYKKQSSYMTYMFTDVREKAKTCLEILNRSGMILWYSKRPGLENTIFLDIKKLSKLFERIFHHDFVGEFERLESPLKKTEADALCKRFTQSGIINEVVLRVIWDNHPLCEKYLHLVEMLGICFKIEANGQRANLGNDYFFPCFVNDECSDEFLEAEWPTRIPTRKIQLESNYKFCHHIPITTFEHLSVKLNKYLLFGADFRKDWKKSVYLQSNAVQILAKRHTNVHHPYIQISLRAHMDNLEHLFSLGVNISKDMDDIMTTCPGVVHDAYFVCRHCAILRNPSPKKWQLPVAMMKPEGTRKWVFCDAVWNRVSSSGNIPAALIMLNLISKFDLFDVSSS